MKTSKSSTQGLWVIAWMPEMAAGNGHGIASTLSHPHHPSSPERYPFDIQSWDLSKLWMIFKKKHGNHLLSLDVTKLSEQPLKIFEVKKCAHLCHFTLGILKHHGRMNKIHQQHSSTTNSLPKTAVKPQAKRKVFQAIRPEKWAIPKKIFSHNHPFCRCELLVSGRVFDPFSDLSLKFQGVSDPENEHVFQPNKVGLTVQHKICDSEILEILLSLKQNSKISTKSLNHPGPRVPTSPPLHLDVTGRKWMDQW